MDYIIKNSSKNEIKNAVWICGKNKDADDRNLEQLRKVIGKEYKFPISCRVMIDDITLEEVQKEAMRVAKGTLAIKVGCPVIALINSYDGQDRLLFSNGSRGIVKGVGSNKVIVDFGAGEVEVTAYTWEIKRYSYNEKKKKVDSVVVAKFSKIPLVLGYATTVHKSQGQTLEAVNIDGNCNFLPGQFYVALSRAKNLDKIYIARACVPLVSREVRNFYNNNRN